MDRTILWLLYIPLRLRLFNDLRTAHGETGGGEEGVLIVEKTAK